MNTKTDNTGAQANWFADGSYGSTNDPMPRFLSDGIWGEPLRRPAPRLGAFHAARRPWRTRTIPPQRERTDRERRAPFRSASATGEVRKTPKEGSREQLGVRAAAHEHH